MSVVQRRRAVEAVQKTIARFQTEKSREGTRAAAERKKALDAAAAASRTSSLSTKMAKLKDAQRYEARAVGYDKKVAELETKIAREQGKLGDANRQLAAAQQQDDNKRAAQQKREYASQLAELSRVQGRLTRHDQLHRTTAVTLERMQALPERLTVLFLASNPIEPTAASAGRGGAVHPRNGAEVRAPRCG